jgi:hypothetical protein
MIKLLADGRLCGREEGQIVPTFLSNEFDIVVMSREG